MIQTQTNPWQAPGREKNVCSVDNDSAVTQYFQTKLVVVEVRNGETREDAWARYLADNPDNAGAHVKIFHYPEPSPLKKQGEILATLPVQNRKEKLV
jgi:hypothetical protein